MDLGLKPISFEPLVRDDIEILVLGTLPGKKSLELGQYYGHSRNRIWKILSTITGDDLPTNYEEKKQILFDNKIGLWDVAQSANRKGSLDVNIKDEIPNNIDQLILICGSIRVIGFNGKKAEKLFYKYFSKKYGIKYISLPSTSPANMAISFEDICDRWSELFITNRKKRVKKC